MRDRRVPIRSKLAALGLGGLAIAALMALEAPTEMFIAMLLNVPGIGMDMMIDGLEILTGPVVVASLLLPRFVPAHVVKQVRAARAGLDPQRVYSQRPR